MKADKKQISGKLAALLEKLQTGYEDVERQINTGFGEVRA
jgi:hypothetical protein